MNETKPSPISLGRVFLALFTLFLIFVSGAGVYRIVARTVRDRHEAETRSQMAVALAEARFAYARTQTAAALGELHNDPVYADECRKYCDLARQHLDVVMMNTRQEEVRKRCEVFSRDFEVVLQFVEIRENINQELAELRRETIVLHDRFGQLHGERREMIQEGIEKQRREIEEKPFVPEHVVFQYTQLGTLVEQTERVFTLARDRENAANPQERGVLDKEITETLQHLDAALGQLKHQLTTGQAKDFVNQWEQALVEMQNLIQHRAEIGKQLQRLSEEYAVTVEKTEQELDELAALLNEDTRREAEHRTHWTSRVGLVCGAGFLFWLFFGILLAVFLIRRAPAGRESEFAQDRPFVATPAPVRTAASPAACDLAPVLEKLQEIIELLKR